MQQLILPAGTSNVTLTSLDDLPAGLYFLQLGLAGQTQHVKVVKE